MIRLWAMVCSLLSILFSPSCKLTNSSKVKNVVITPSNPLVYTKDKKVYFGLQAHTIKGVAYGGLPPGVSNTNKFEYEKNQLLPEFSRNYFAQNGKPHIQTWGDLITEDALLMKDAGINTIRLYYMVDQQWFFDTFHANGVKAIVGIGGYDITPDEVKAYVKKFINHPGILSWDLGNEWNLSYHFKEYKYQRCNLPDLAQSKSKDPQRCLEWLNEAMNTIQAWANAIRLVDKKRPIGSVLVSLGIDDLDLIFNGLEQNEHFNGIKNHEIFKLVDYWGLNAYIGKSSLYPGAHWWREKIGKPFYISEYGTDAYFTRFKNINGQFEFDKENSGEKEATKVQGEIAKFTATEACHDKNIIIGSTIMAWADEWWKGGDSNEQKIEGSHQEFQPDKYSNEAWWGIVRANRKKRPAYEALKTVFKDCN